MEIQGSRIIPDKKTVDKILNLQNELKTLCQESRVPMYSTVAVEMGEEKTEYRTVCATPLSLGVKLSDDKISSLELATVIGFKIQLDEISLAEKREQQNKLMVAAMGAESEKEESAWED